MTRSPGSAPNRVEHVPLVIIEDLDRVHWDPPLALERWGAALEVQGLGRVAAGVMIASEATESDGGSFGPHTDTRRIIRELYQNELSGARLDAYVEKCLEATRKTFREMDGPSFVYPDSYGFWKLVDGHRIPRKALTWATELPWQWDKVAAGYDGDVEMAEATDKSIYIRQYQRPDGMFEIDIKQPDGSTITYVTPEVCEIEDKTMAFYNLPAVCSGFIVHRMERPLKKQLGVLPPHLVTRVETVRSLTELTVVNGRLVRDNGALTESAPRM